MAGDLRTIQNYFPLFSAIFAGEIIAGISLGTFIVSVNLHEWCKEKTLGPCDQILLVLGISNVLYPCINGFIIFAILLPLPIQSLIYYQVSYGCAMFTIMSSSWLTAVLCSFYCLKIVNFRTGLMAQLKVKIDCIVPWLIAAAELLSANCSVPFGFSIKPFSFTNKTSYLPSNSSSKQTDVAINSPLIFISIILNIAFPFCIVICTTISIVWSLRKHTLIMKKNVRDSDSLKVHRTAARTMLSLLFIYLIFYLANTFLISILSPPMFQFIHYALSILVMAFSPLQSLVFILANYKLMQNYQKLSHYVSCKANSKSESTQV